MLKIVLQLAYCVACRPGSDRWVGRVKESPELPKVKSKAVLRLSTDLSEVGPRTLTP